jgi:polysaccharide biosynthesis/export protein
MRAWLKTGLIALMESCLTLGMVVAQTKVGEIQPVSSANSDKAVAARVRVGPGDLLEVTVFDVAELKQDVRVSDLGDANFTFLGSVHVAGLTTAELQKLIEDRLQKGDYVKDPQVSVMISEYGTQGVSVLGQVAKPGVYAVLGSRTLLDVISEAGGITTIAAHEATVKRRQGGEIFTASLSDNPGELLASEVELWPGDTIVVPRAGIVYVIGDVGRPGGFVMENSGQVTLLQAVALAAGVNRTAAQSKTRVIRKTSDGYEDKPINLKLILEGKAPDLPLEREDIVYVPPSTSRTLLFHMPQVLESAAASATIYGAAP